MLIPDKDRIEMDALEEPKLGKCYSEVNYQTDL